MPDAPPAGPASSTTTRTSVDDAVRPAHAVLRGVLEEVTARPGELRAVFAASSEALVAFDRDRHILHANQKAEALFGYEPGELDGAPTDQIVVERMRQPGAPPMVPMADVMQVDLPGLRRDGSELNVEWVLGSTTSPAGPLFVMTVRDRAASDRAIDALRASEERFRLLVDGVHGYAIYMLDPAGHVSSWNLGAERVKGWKADEILGRSYEVFFTAEDRAAGVPQRLLDLASLEGHKEAGGWRVRKDGSRFAVSSTLTTLRAASGELRGFAKITQDLTERLQAQELERRLGDERAGREAAEAAEQRARASEDRLRRLQRVTAALSEAATPFEVASVLLDQSLHALGATGAAVYALSSDGTSLELLDQRGHPPAPLEMFSRLPLSMRSPLTDAARERRASFYTNLEECAACFPELRDAIASGGFEASAALPLLAHGSVLGTLGIRFPMVRSFDAADRALLVTLSDLCAQALDRSRLFAAEREARAAAESASRSKDEFLAILGHELRNPLAPIVTALSLMKLRSGGDSQKERTVIERQVTHLVRLVDDLLDVSRITRGKVELKKERIELAAVVSKAVELSSPLLEQRQHHLTVAVPAQDFEVDVDTTRLAQVVSNLLINSAKYTPIGGHIAISATRSDGRIALTVRDDGMGIDAAILPHVFELFTQERQGMDRSQGGLGLGLAIVKTLVSMHDGSVSASSEGRGKGSAFTVDLPAAAPLDSAAALRVAPAVPRPVGAGRRVLIVDDNADAAELLAEVLRERGHTTVIAHDGPRALTLADSFHPDVALLDIGLPVMDGYELARRLRSGLGAVRLIAVTGYGQEADRARAHAAGFDAHMIKPVEPDALDAALG